MHTLRSLAHTHPCTRNHPSMGHSVAASSMQTHSLGSLRVEDENTQPQTPRTQVHELVGQTHMSRSAGGGVPRVSPGEHKAGRPATWAVQTDLDRGFQGWLARCACVPSDMDTSTLPPLLFIVPFVCDPHSPPSPLFNFISILFRTSLGCRSCPAPQTVPHTR